jgi:hypothetical protein
MKDRPETIFADGKIREKRKIRGRQGDGYVFTVVVGASYQTLARFSRL